MTAWSRPLLKRAAGFVAVSRSVAATYRPHLPVDTPINVIPIFMSTDYSIAPRPTWLPLGDYVAFVGVLAPYKGVDTIIQTARAMPDQQFVIAGVPIEEANYTHLPPNVSMAFNLSHPEVMAVWQNAKAALVPSEWAEPGGTVAMEALRVGTPVIASNLGGLPEVVLDGINGLIVPARNSAALGAAITTLVDSPDLRAAMSAAAKESSKRFTAHALMGDIVAMYEQTISDFARR
jgi:glycosyltransferase involved in cell wall biosynthesis